ncbi:hypothetical protein NMD63_05685 [Edwardsiella tarda]|uniref:hypothetical protein n=1 Tax=Edwardsiella tarda TaxID=636 RepID=UPI00351C46E0
MTIPVSVLQNKELVKYYNLMRGDSVSQLSELQLYEIGSTLKCIDILPPNGGSLYFNDGVCDLVYEGHLYKAVPDFLKSGFASFTTKSHISNDGTSLQISNVNQEYLSMCLNGMWDQSKVNLHVVILNPSDGSVLYGYRRFSGYIDNFKSAFKMSDTSTTTVNINSVWKKLDLEQKLLCSTSVHQSNHNGDHIFDLMNTLHNATQTWKSND